MRYFSVEEANDLLPDLEVWVSELSATHQRILSLRPEVESVLVKSRANSGSATASELYLTFGRFERLLDQIRATGVEVKDVGTGLCDFPAQHAGRDIYLCWRLGEARVEWWHDLHTGFAGRRHIRELG